METWLNKDTRAQIWNELSSVAAKIHHHTSNKRRCHQSANLNVSNISFIRLHSAPSCYVRGTEMMLVLNGILFAFSKINFATHTDTHKEMAVTIYTTTAADAATTTVFIYWCLYYTESHCSLWWNGMKICFHWEIGLTWCASKLKLKTVCLCAPILHMRIKSLCESGFRAEKRATTKLNRVFSATISKIMTTGSGW